ncbi:MAG: hypothetical protein AB7E59_04280 [Pusillimonas sp.]
MATLALRTSAQNQFPTTVSTAAHAAGLWFVQPTPSMTLAAWRDHFRDLHLSGIRCDDWQERMGRTAAWNAAFNDGLAAVIAGGADHA